MQIKTQSELETVCKHAKETGCIGLDTEFIPENSYYPELALIQIAVENECYILDPLGTVDLSPLERLIGAKDVTVVVHAGAQDMGIFFQRTKVPPQSVFDTQIAAAFIGMGHQISYAALVQQFFNVSLSKGQSFTNWLKRPLKPEQIKYALDDVAYLVSAFRKMKEQLHQAKRLEWALDEMKHYEDAAFYLASTNHPEKRIKKNGQMKGRELVMLEALANWREEEAQKRNLPRKKILSDYTIVDLAKRKPTTAGELLSLRSADHMARRYADRLVQVITHARNTPFPEQEFKYNIPLSEEQKLLVEYVSFCMKGFCMREKLSSTLLATRSELEHLVSDYFSESFFKDHHRILTGWRLDAVGKDILKCLRGELGVHFDPNEHRLVFQ